MQSANAGTAGPSWNVPHLGLRILFAKVWHLQRWGNPHMAAPWWRWYWNDQEGMHVHYGGHDFALTPETVLLIPANTDFAGSLHQACHHLSMPFTVHGDFRLASLAPFEIPVETIASQRELSTILTTLFTTGDDPVSVDPGLGVRLHALVHAALAQLPDRVWPTHIDDPRVAEVRDLLRRDCLTPPANDALAKQVGLHPASLVRLFKAHTGMTPQHFALRLRLEGASEALLLERLPVEEVAKRWGFSDRQHLTRLMRRHCQCTPGSLRRLPTS